MKAKRSGSPAHLVTRSPAHRSNAPIAFSIVLGLTSVSAAVALILFVRAIRVVYFAAP